MNDEPSLPSTPTFEGRKPGIKNLGYSVEFTQLWPLLLGLIGTGSLVFVFTAFAWRPFPWWACVLVAPMPLLMAHLYLKKFVENALPHTQGDFIAKVWAMRLDFTRPPKWCPFMPRIRFNFTIGGEPTGGSVTHPLLTLAKLMNEQAEKSKANRR